MRSNVLLAVASLLMPFAAAAPSQAQAPYPTKPVRLMVGASAGGGTDIVARMLADKFTESMKGTYVVENLSLIHI